MLTYNEFIYSFQNDSIFKICLVSNAITLNHIKALGVGGII